MAYFIGRGFGRYWFSAWMGISISYFLLLIACPLFTESRLVEPQCRVLNVIPMPGSSVCQCLDRIHFSLLLKRKLALGDTSPFLKCPRLFLLPMLLLLSGDIELNPGPSPVILGHLNARSMASVFTHIDKPELIQDVIRDANIGVCSVNETWLTTDSLPSTIASCLPDGYSFLNAPRTSGRGGGVGFI